MFEDIKGIHFTVVLNDLRISYKDYGDYALAKAEYRNDFNPSLNIFRDKASNIWRWKDLATGKTGTWIDLYMLYGYTFSQALARLYWLKEKASNLKEEALNLKEKALNPKEETHLNDITYPKVEVLQWDLRAKNFLYWAKGYKEIPPFVYKVKVFEKDKAFEYYGIKDVCGNWHVRTFKAKQQLKRIIRQNKTGNSYSLFTLHNKGIIVICEGLHDAMALWTLKLDDYDILCLNSTVNVEKALKVLGEYDKIIVATDTDEAGQKAKDKIKKALKGKKLQEVVFENGKDVDEAYRLKVNIGVKPLLD